MANIFGSCLVQSTPLDVNTREHMFRAQRHSSEPSLDRDFMNKSKNGHDNSEDDDLVTIPLDSPSPRESSFRIGAREI